MTDADQTHLLTSLLQRQFPGIKSQAQFNAFEACMEAFRALTNAILEGKKDSEVEYRKIMNDAFEALRNSTTLTEKFAEAPEAATSQTAQEFVKPPTKFSEYDTQRALMTELAQLQSVEQLNQWYRENRPRIDEVTSPTLRNPLLDAIRARKIHLLE